MKQAGLARGLAICIAASLLGASTLAMASEPEYWSYTPALRESAEQKVEVRLWTHKGNAILQDEPLWV